LSVWANPLSVSFYDKLGGLNTAKYVVHKASATDDSTFTIKLTDILGPDGKSLLKEQDDNGDWYAMGTVEVTTDPDTGKTTRAAGKGAPETAYPVNINLGGEAITYTVSKTGELVFKGTWPSLKFNGSTGEFVEVGAKDGGATNLSLGLTIGKESPFLQIDASDKTGGVIQEFGNLTMYAQDGVSNVKPSRGTEDGKGTGNAAGSLTGFTVQNDGKIFGVYTNGDKNLLGQIAVATFANPSGLEAAGNSLFSATKNSGDFDGIGIDISEVGKFSIGALEMSDVDLASEFTNMITTQRGFQANSRVITTSDSMLEELVNLKR
jgi:flagellar hook protein FlgE